MLSAFQTKDLAMLSKKMQKSLEAETFFTVRDVLQSLGIAVLLVSAVFVIVGFLLLPVAPVR